MLQTQIHMHSVSAERIYKRRYGPFSAWLVGPLTRRCPLITRRASAFKLETALAAEQWWGRGGSSGLAGRGGVLFKSSLIRESCTS